MSTRPQPDWYYHRHPYASTPLAEAEEPQLLPIQDQSDNSTSKTWMAYKAPLVQWYKNAMLIKKSFWHDLEACHQIIWYPYKGISESVGSTDYLHLFILVVGYYMLNLVFVVFFVAILTCSTLALIYLPFCGFLALPIAYLQTVLVSTTICNSMVKDVYYGGFAKWLLYSMSSGLLESIPILSGFFIGTNVVGASLWIVKERKDQEDPILPPLTPVQPIEPAEESHAPPVQQSISHVNPP